MKRILMMIFIVALVFVGCSEETKVETDKIDVTGYYEGYINVAGNKINIETDLEHGETLSGQLSIPGQGLFDLDLLETKVEGSSIEFKIDLGGVIVDFKGTYGEDTITGVYTQNEQEFTFTLNKSEKVVYENREMISVENDGVKLTGELIVPEIEGEMPVVLIIAGSGPTDMDGNSMAGVSANSYLYLAEELEKQGIASLRYNKRILGNAISEEDLSVDDFIADAKYLTEMLQDDTRFSSVYLIGHSQGALIAEVVASDLDVDGLVLLAGAGRPIDEVMMDQLVGQVDAATLLVIENIFTEMKAGNVVKDIAPQLQSLVRESVQPFLMSWMAYDPIQILDKIDEPILAIFGSEDIQIGNKEVEVFEASSKISDIVVLDGMNHVLKKTGSDRNENIATYSNPDLPIHESLIDVLVDFIQ